MTSASYVKKIFPPAHQTIDKGHGRVETRTLCASSLLNDYLDFPHCGQVFKIIRERTTLTTGKTSSETVYGITSLTAQQADAERLLTLSRGHWSIEIDLTMSVTCFSMKTDINCEKEKAPR